MIPISSAKSGDLLWFKNKNRYELRLRERVLGWLQKTSFWSSDSYAESNYGKWKFLRSGFWCNGVEVLDTTSNQCIATFKTTWGRGSLVFSNGKSFQIVSKGCWRPVWSAIAEDGQTMLQMRSRDGAVELLSTEGLSEDRMISLAFFVKHYAQQVAEDDATAAMVAAVS